MHDRLIQSVALIVIALGLLGAFMLSPTINHQRVERQLTYDTEVGDTADPAYTFVASLGSFRGLAVNALWQRAEALKQEGKFYEANNLAEMITTLQPRYPEVWNFQGWNMAYNISVKCKTAEERWDWVQKGINLYRDKGIPNNPNAVVLYRSLAWILRHKMSGETDDLNKYYKRQFADQWQTLLGAPAEGMMLRPEFRDGPPTQAEFDPDKHAMWRATEQVRLISAMADRYLLKPGKATDPDDREYIDSNYYTAISAEAKQRFYAEHPGIEPVVRELEQLRGPDGELLGLGLNSKTLRALGKLRMYEEAGYQMNDPRVVSRETVGDAGVAIYTWSRDRPQRVMFNFNPLIDVQAFRARVQAQYPDADVLDLSPMMSLLRAQVLVAEMHMDPAYMLWCMDAYGPMDWRHPAAHSMYWTSLGTLRAEQWVANKDRVDMLNANRDVLHSLQELTHNGKVIFRARIEALGAFGEGRIGNAPDLRMAPAYGLALERLKQLIASGELGDRISMDSYEQGHENYLQACLFLFYYDNQIDQAQAYYDQLREEYDKPDSTYYDEYGLSLSDFARARLEDDLRYQDVAMIRRQIQLAFERGLAERNPVVMLRFLDAARASYDSFREDRQTVAKQSGEDMARQDIPPFEDLLLFEYLTMMDDPTYSLSEKSGIWQIGAQLLAAASSDEVPLLYVAYAQMGPIISRQAEAEGFTGDLGQLYPEPRGYREWIAEQQQQGGPTPDKIGP